MTKTIVLIVFSLVFSLKPSAKNIEFGTAAFNLSVDSRGYIVSIYDKVNKKEYLPESQNAPLMSIRVKNVTEHPAGAFLEGDLLTLKYPISKVEAKVKPLIRQGYVTFELVSINGPDNIELIIWGPYPTSIREIVGECVGVVRNREFAFGIQALNAKTLGGYPTEESDIEPSFTIFETGINIDPARAWRNQKNYRGQTARVLDSGSIVQAYTRNRNRGRIISNWEHDYYVAPPFNDGGVIGSKIALFGCPPEKALETIGQIEIQEGLPHPMIEGEWAKTSPLATASYLIIGFSESTLDKALELTKKAGLKYLYQGDPFKAWGHFVLDEKAFPGNWKSLKNCVDHAAAQGVKLGVHTLSNFITINDSYVSPVPDKRLAKVGESNITSEIDEKSVEIPIASPRFFNEMKNNSLHSVVIGNEIIRYREVTASEPWKLTGCVRGAFGTTAIVHHKGEVIGKLMDHAYKVFLGNAELSEEISKNIARLFNETGLMQISFDGLEGTWSTGMGQYGRILFTKTWYDNLAPGLKGKVINDASNPAHFNWHINTRYNWGEPWYAGFRESQTGLRLMNQDFFHRNFIPSMLGWFSMSAQTSVEDVEWLLARAAGFDAGFAFNLSYSTVEMNGESDTILNTINTWESARMAGVFSPEQKDRMQDIKNEFHLERQGANEWKLFPLHIQHFVHEQNERQPGEPVTSTFEFDNPYGDQPLVFMISHVKGEKDKGSQVEKIAIEVNDYDKLEIPVTLEADQVLKLDETGKLRVFTQDWKMVKEVTINSRIPVFSKGRNKINFSAESTGERSSKCTLEMKTIGEPELVRGNIKAEMKN